MRVDDSSMAEELEHRFTAQLGRAIAEAYAKGNPELATALDLTREWMARSSGETIARLRDLGIYSFPPDVYHILLELAAKQTIQQALERVEKEKREAETRLLSKRAQKWAIPLSIGSIVIALLSIAVGTYVQLWLKLHH